MAQPSNTDIISGLDPTALPSITGAQLETMVGGATPFTDKGIVMVTTDVGGVAQVPTANITTKWQTYLWLQISPQTTSVALYCWNPNQSNANPNFLNWQPVSLANIPANSIQGFQLAPSTITYDKILNINLSQIVGYTTLLTTVLNPAAGDISGSYAVGFTINNAAVTLAKFDTTGAVTQVLTANGSGSAPTWQTPPKIYTGLANPNSGGSDDGKVVAVNSGAAGTFKYLTSTQVGRILQTILTIDNVNDSTTAVCSATTLPTTSNTKTNANLQAAITPLSTTSTLLVEVGMYLASSTADGAVCALFRDAGASAIAAGVALTAAANSLVFLEVRYKVVSGSLTTTTFKGAFAALATGSTYYNSVAGSTIMFGGTLGVNSYIRVTEYL